MSSVSSKIYGEVTLEAGAVSWSLDVDLGDFKADGIHENNQDVVGVMRRGVFFDVAYTQEVEQALSFTVHVKNESLTHATAERILDYIRKTGSASAATSQAFFGASAPGPMLWKVIYRIKDGATVLASATFPRVRLSGSLDESGETTSLAVSGRCFGAPTLT